MKLTVVGCSPAVPDPGGANSAYLVEGAGRILLDCGPGALARLRADADWPEVDAIVISHLHLDHWGDLVPWTFGARERGRDPVELWLPPGGGDRLRALGEQLSFGRSLAEVFAVAEYSERERFAAGGLELWPAQVPHYDQPTWGLRVTDGSATLAYSADTGPTPVLAELARDAGLLLCEAALAEPEQDRRGHLTVEEAIEAFRASGARELLLTHRAVELPVPEGFARARSGQVVAI